MTANEVLLKSKTPVLIQGADVSGALSLLASNFASAPIDVRDAALDEQTVRQKIRALLQEKQPIILVVGEELTEPVRALVSELCEGQVNFSPGDTRRVPGLKLIVVSTAAHPGEWANQFGVRLQASSLS